MIRSRYTAAITDKPWWLAGGIDPSACVAAYQAVGAASLEASYINLANPGTYTLTNVNGLTCNSITGWVGEDTKYLNTGISDITIGIGSIFVRFTDATRNTTEYLFGSVISNHFFFCNPQRLNAFDRYGLISTLGTRSKNQSGVVGISGTYAYANGSIDGEELASGTATLSGPILLLGASTNAGGSSNTTFIGQVQAASIYKYTHTPHQVAELTRAMNAL